jgi:Rrf2 family iron-sulfur cluster assembly transcriptional regulator
MRLEITRRAELAVRALALLGTTSTKVKAPVLARELGTTAPFVPQVVGPLVKAGWVSSDPGPTGGYRSIVALDEVSVLQVIEAVDGATDVGRCVVADRPCRADEPCVLHTAWGRARAELLAVLGQSPMAAVGEPDRITDGGGR